ncbi:MAG: DNA mismatch repair endonuclease MutL [Desulfobacteraceae bacterium]|nr:DNA mismatch repair endonuclease MutL [Desulfobacteraceae bacterium]
MASIRILPEILSNQIAAGEVVERPASVVKEFLENSIDAGSSRIHVEIEQGGRSLIRVADDGAGMNYEDALLAIERYATSKIADQSDLAEIRSLGFRGEALPSIASVSKFRMVTRNKESDAATQITVEGGKPKDVSRTGAPVGTMVSARELFYNTPARRKFLKTVNTEMGHISETMACIALSRPEIAFRLDHNQKTIKDWPGAKEPFERVADVLGRELENLLYPVKFSNSAAGVSGWVADPSVTRSGTSKIYVFVNGRFIRNRAIIYALCEGFRGRLMKGRFPVAAVFVDVPASEVDVNVHPAKQEVRFLKQKQVIEAVRKAVEKAWSSAMTGAFKKRDSPGVRPPWEYEDLTQPGQPAQNMISQSPAEYQSRRQSSETPGRTQEELFEQVGFFTDSVIIGQFQNTYIICDKSGELVMIDQHAAHERILYERLRATRKDGKAQSVQRLLMPETVELGYRQAPAIHRLLPELNAMGFEIEHFGGETFVVKAVPSALAERQITPLITDIAETAENTDTGPAMDDLLDQCITVMACHGAIRANQALSRQEMADLLKQLDACENPFNCPHGRPTLIRWPMEFLEKSFKRIV